jgi:hypothetical protein
MIEGPYSWSVKKRLVNYLKEFQNEIKRALRRFYK